MKNVEWDSVILCSYGIYRKEYKIIFSCIINLNIIYLLKIPLYGIGIWREGGRVYEALLPKFDGVYKIFLLHTSWRKLSMCQSFSCFSLPPCNCWYNWYPRMTDTFPCRCFRPWISIKFNKYHSWKMAAGIKTFVKSDILSQYAEIHSATL